MKKIFNADRCLYCSLVVWFVGFKLWHYLDLIVISMTDGGRSIVSVLDWRLSVDLFLTVSECLSCLWALALCILVLVRIRSMSVWVSIGVFAFLALMLGLKVSVNLFPTEMIVM